MYRCVPAYASCILCELARTVYTTESNTSQGQRQTGYIDLKALSCEELLGPSGIVFTLCAFRKLSDGLFLRQCSEVAELYPNIEFNSMIIDNCCMQVRRRRGREVESRFREEQGREGKRDVMSNGEERWKQGLGRRAREGG